jgi:hypothetical protein
VATFCGVAATLSGGKCGAKALLILKQHVRGGVDGGGGDVAVQRRHLGPIMPLFLNE